jgi:serine/threonine protein phosphatase PrpC
MALILRYAVRSDLGLVRSNNEDAVYAGPRLLAIADGMGGHAAGEVASKIVISAMENLDEDRSFGDLLAALRDTVVEANHRISEAVEKSRDLEGMGTTLTALRFSGSQVGLVHVGDSRAYLLRGGMLSQITHDDTYVQYLVDSGKLTPDEAKDHPRKSVILRALLGTEVEPDVSIREAREGDRYLLCTDGLTDVVSTDTLLETLRIPDPQESADRLVELALRGGGPDNVTVIVADVVRAGPGDFADDVPVIGGAFVDPAAADVPGEDSPAERAARIGRATSEAPTPPPSGGRRRRWRTPLVAAIVLAVVAGGLAGAYALTQTYYFVGRDGSEVAIFRGVNTQFGPLKFFNVYKNTDLRLNDLTAAVRSQVSDGINARNEGDAERIVTNLHQQLKPLCPMPTPTPTPTPTRSVPSPTHRSTARTVNSPARAAATSSRTPTPTRSPTPTPTITPSPSPTSSVDCRSGS